MWVDIRVRRAMDRRIGFEEPDDMSLGVSHGEVFAVLSWKKRRSQV